MNRRLVRIAVLAGLGAFSVAGPASAWGASQVGETFTPDVPSDVNATYLQSTSPGGQYVMPSGGVVTSWSHLAPAGTQQLKLKIARRLSGNQFTIIGESTLETISPGTLNTFETRIAVQAGDVLGVYAVVSRGLARSAMGYGFHGLEGDPAPGSSPTFGASAGQFQFDLSATLEPDCDGDGLGDETQDPSIASCHPRTLTLDANKNKVKKGRKVTLSGQLTQLARQAECRAGQPVELQRKKPSQATFTTVEQPQTDAAGSFTAREKVKKTFEYRAQVAETATCASGLSNIEKVKAKNKK
jgi:hypothetical protein